MSDQTSNHHGKKPRLTPVVESSLNRESWKIFQIMAEFVEGFERLAPITPSVSLFGSARTKPDHPHYQTAQRIAYLLSEAGFAVVSGGVAVSAPARAPRDSSAAGPRARPVRG